MDIMDGLKILGFLVSVYISFKIAVIAYDGIKGKDNKNDSVPLPD
jgi:hypothetical protein